MLSVCHPKFCMSIVFSFSWGHFNSLEKLKTMITQNLGVTNKEHYGMLQYFWSGQMGSITRHGKPLCHPERIIWEEWSLIALTFSDGSTPV